MAIDFEKIAGAAKDAHEKKLADAAEALRLERQAHSEKALLCIAFLNAQVVTVLNAAKPIFKKDEIDIDIKTDFDFEKYLSKLPSVHAKMSRPAPGRTDGYRIESAEAKFSFDGSKLSAQIESDPMGGAGKQKIGEAKDQQVEVLMGQSISQLAASFYRMVERYRVV